MDRLVLNLALLAVWILPAASQADRDCWFDPPASCAECLLRGPQCGWCIEVDYSGTRCNTMVNLQAGGCDQARIMNPQGNGTVLTQNLPLTEAGLRGIPADDIVQVSPQRAHLELRPGESAQLRLQVRQVQDYPVDMYYLMDLSSSMFDDLTTLRTLGSRLASTMQRITSNFRLGLGFYVDKTALPYVNPYTIDTVCAQYNSPCARVFSYRNALPLTTNISAFTDTLEREEVAVNRDFPEGGFDALMQVAACDDQIGWREGATRLVVYPTDALSKMAGDGKLAAILPPNDGQCHLHPGTGEYLESNNQDYPSIGQLANILRQKNIQPIFAIAEDRRPAVRYKPHVLPTYQRLSQLLPGSTMATLESDSSNIVELVEEAYRQLRSQVKLQVASPPAELQLQFTSTCRDGQVTPGGTRCSNLTVGDTVEFEVTLTATGCPKDGQAAQFSLVPVGFGGELTVNVDFLCSCGCEDSSQPASPHCSSGNGTLECGVCMCESNRYGQQCECSAEDETSASGAQCVAPGADGECSGRGVCVCGRCECGDRYSGPFCGCDNFSCDRSSGQLCGGPSRGVCKCGQCACVSGWQGNACQCSSRTDTCMVDGRICNDQGRCECGKCVCNPDSPYGGERCDSCPTCPGHCVANQACVQCLAFQTGQLTSEQCSERCPLNVTIVQSLPDDILDSAETCRFHDDDDCIVTFTYGKSHNNELEVTVKKTKECPGPVPVLPIVLGVIGGIVLIGLALLVLWRILIYLYDRVEYRRFERERQAAKFTSSENPLYKSNTTRFSNPTFRGRKSSAKLYDDDDLGDVMELTSEQPSA
ncbi:integrin beta-3-like [Branchiostoma floridae]|uniref:Integrin beta n=1 Tax=Branchiostoma floridae TaxID=7739 RepID=A0A9J7HPG3_BRAFL|nr:integrin beta-3-like [Branchiostoma floridae]